MRQNAIITIAAANKKAQDAARISKLSRQLYTAEKKEQRNMRPATLKDKTRRSDA